MVHTTFMIILSIISAICVTGFILGLLKENESLWQSSLVLSFVVLLFGWGIIAAGVNMTTINKVIEKEDLVIFKTPAHMILEYDTYLEIDSTIERYVAIDKANHFWIEYNYNAYGFINEKHIQFTDNLKNVPEDIRKKVDEGVVDDNDRRKELPDVESVRRKEG